jgi:hypothetical protein
MRYEDYDMQGLERVLALCGVPDSEAAAETIANSEWMLRHEFRTVKSFLRGALEGIEESE